MTIVDGLGFGGRDAADWFEESMMVEPGDPFERGQFDRLLGLPRRSAMNHLGLVETVDGFGHRIVVGVADAAHRGRDAGLGQTLGIANADVLNAPDALLCVKWQSETG